MEGGADGDLGEGDAVGGDVVPGGVGWERLARSPVTRGWGGLRRVTARGESTLATAGQRHSAPRLEQGRE